MTLGRCRQGDEPKIYLITSRRANPFLPTALHWLTVAELRALYRTLASLLRPGGLFLDGDHLTLDETRTPVLARLDRAVEEAEDRRRFPAGHEGRAEDWRQWWQAVAADPTLAGAAGFAEIGTLWQRGSNRLLAAVR